MYKCFWQEFDTEAEARALIMRSIMNYERNDPDTMRIKLINFLYHDYYYTPYVFVTYDNTEIITKGRHDPCVGIRAVPIGEAMMALVLADALLMWRAYR